MLQIHFIDDTGQPLCSVPDTDRWLWTVNRRSVTCSGCLAALAGGVPAAPAAEADDAPPPALGADKASRTG